MLVIMDWNLLIVFVAGLLASFYGTTAGGGGLITISILILLGLPAQNAVATIMAGALGVSAVGLFSFHRAGKIDYRTGTWLAIIASLGALIGTFVLLNISESFLEKVISAAFLFVLLSVLFKKDLGTEKKIVGKKMHFLGSVLFFPLGIYTSVINAGAAIFANYLLTHFFGMTFLESAGVRKIIFIVPLLASTVIYSLNGIVFWNYALVLLIAQSIGAYVGSEYALKKGDGWVRWLFVIVIVVSLVKLLS